MTAIALLLWIILAAFFAFAWLAGRFGPAASILVVPLMWIAAVGVLVARGQVESIRDVLGAAGGFFVILIVSGAGRAARSKAAARPVRNG
jgi:hypothetical protein